MDISLDNVTDPKYRQEQLPALPARLGAGAPLALTPSKAGTILALICHGSKPASAFVAVGVSPRTVERYKSFVYDYKEADEQDDQQAREKVTSECPHVGYLACFMELLERAEEACNVAYVLTRAKLMSGGIAKTVTVKSRSRKRQSVLNGELVDLVDEEVTTTEVSRDMKPQLVPRDYCYE